MERLSQFAMRKGQVTREYIIAQAATLFNTKGYTGSSLSDLMSATGLKKGGIYNHFQNKEEILLAAFDYSINQVNDVLRDVIKSEFTATAKLKAVVNFYRQYALKPIIQGGCPILNSTIEADDANPQLKKRVQKAYTTWIDSLGSIISRGIRRGEFRDNIDAEAAAIILITSIEGGIAMTRSFNEARYMAAVADQLIRYIDNELKA